MKEVNQIMEAYVGIVRSNLRLTRAWNRLDILMRRPKPSSSATTKATRELCELRNMINVGYLITKQAMERKESRGLHYTIDYPGMRGNKRGCTLDFDASSASEEYPLSRKNGGVSETRITVPTHRLPVMLRQSYQ